MRILTIILTLLPFIAHSAWWDTDWDYRVEISTNPDSVLITETGTHLYYYPLSEMPSDFWSNVRSDGGDVRMTDDADTQIACWIADFDDTNETGALWFQGDANATVAESFYVYYGNATATTPSTSDTYGRDNVFDMMQAGWSLHEGRPSSVSYPNLPGTNSSVLDLTSATTDTGDSVNGKLESTALNHDRTINDRQEGSNNNTYKPSFPLTALAWGRVTDFTVSGGKGFLTKYAAISGFRIFYFRLDASNNLTFGKYDSSESLDDYVSSVAVTTVVSTNDWALYATSINSDGSSAQHYINGSAFGSSGSYPDNVIQTPTTSGSYGSITAGGIEQGLNWSFPGDLQYIFLADSAWSANKIKTYYRNTNTPSTFWTTSAQESQGGVGRRIYNNN